MIPCMSVQQNNVERVLLVLLTVCIFFSSLSTSLTIITYATAFLLLFISNDWSVRWNRIKNNPAAMSFWLLFMLFVIGSFYSTSPAHMIWYDIKKHSWLLITPFFMMICFDDAWRERMLTAFMCSMIFILCLSYFVWITKINLTLWIPDLKKHPGTSIFMQHIQQSFVMCLAAFICGYRFLFREQYKIMYALLFLLMSIDILFISGSRTGYIIYTVLFLYLGLIRFAWKGLFFSILLSVSLLVSAYCLSSHFQTRIKKMFFHLTHAGQIHHVTSIGNRIEMLSIARDMVRVRPWFGYGTGGIHAQFDTVVPLHDRVFNTSSNYIESIYLNFLLEFGFFGLTVLLIAFIMQVKATFQLPHSYRCLMQAVLIAVLVGGIFNQFFVSFGIVHPYSLLAVLCFSALSCHPVR